MKRPLTTLTERRDSCQTLSEKRDLRAASPLPLATRGEARPTPTFAMGHWRRAESFWRCDETLPCRLASPRITSGRGKAGHRPPLRRAAPGLDPELSVLPLAGSDDWGRGVRAYNLSSARPRRRTPSRGPSAWRAMRPLWPLISTSRALPRRSCARPCAGGRPRAPSPARQPSNRSSACLGKRPERPRATPLAGQQALYWASGPSRVPATQQCTSMELDIEPNKHRQGVATF